MFQINFLNFDGAFMNTYLICFCLILYICMYLWGVTEGLICSGAATVNELIKLFHVNFMFPVLQSLMIVRGN